MKNYFFGSIRVEGSYILYTYRVDLILSGCFAVLGRIFSVILRKVYSFSVFCRIRKNFLGNSSKNLYFLCVSSYQEKFLREEPVELILSRCFAV